MRGLLVRDVCLCMKRKTTMILFVGLALIFSITMEGYFSIAYSTFLLLMYGVGNMNYDEAGNGYPFLLSLPVTRERYVAERFVFSLLCGGVGFLGSFLVSLVVNLTRGTLAEFLSDPIGLFLSWPTFTLVLALYIPIQLKFGMERSRIVLIVVVACLGCIGYTASKLTGFDIARMSGAFMQVPGVAVGAVLVGMIVLVLMVSYFASVSIIRKKEF